MSYKEQLMQLVNDLPEWLAANALTVLQVFVRSVAEAADDEFCIKLLDNGLADADEDDEAIPKNELAARWGIEFRGIELP